MAEEAVTEVVNKFSTSLKEPPFFCKLAELTFCIVSIALAVGPYNNLTIEQMMYFNRSHMAIAYIAIGGYILIDGVVIIGYLRGEKIPKKMALLFSIAGAVLCIVAGYYLIIDRTYFSNRDSLFFFPSTKKYRQQMLASGIFAVLAGVTFVIDTYFTYKSG